jgi:hypothetical protein
VRGYLVQPFWRGALPGLRQQKLGQAAKLVCKMP